MFLRQLLLRQGGPLLQVGQESGEDIKNQLRIREAKPIVRPLEANET